MTTTGKLLGTALFLAACLGLNRPAEATEPLASLPPPDQLQRLLADEDPAVRRQALSPVVKLLELDAEYRPVLWRTFADADDDVRMFAAIGLAATGEHGPRVTAAIVKLLGTENRSYLPQAGEFTQWALAAQGAKSAPLLIAALQADDATARHRAARVIETIGPDAKDVLPALSAALRDANELQRGPLLFAKWKVDGDDESAIAQLVPLLQSPRGRSCGGAADHLWRMGPHAKQAVPALLAAMQEHQDDAVIHALDELCQWFAPEIIPAFRHALDDPDLQEAAAGVLVHHDVIEEPLIPVLAKMLNADRQLHLHASQIAQVLGSFGPKAQVAVPGLVRALHSPSGHARVMAAEALGMIGPAAREALPALRAALDDADVAAAAKIAIERISADK